MAITTNKAIIIIKTINRIKIRIRDNLIITITIIILKETRIEMTNKMFILSKEIVTNKPTKIIRIEIREITLTKRIVIITNYNKIIKASNLLVL